MLNGTQGDIIILRYKTQNRNRMTKSKMKREIPECCYNCEYSEFSGDVYDQGAGISYPEFKCELDRKKHHAEYSCKKWEEMK